MTRVVITDCDFGAGEIEAAILGSDVDVEVCGSRDPHAIIEAAQGADGLFVQWATVDRELLAALPGVRAVVRYGIGLDNIDLAAAAEAGVVVRNVDDYCLDEVADHAAAMIYARDRRLWEFGRAVQDGLWSPSVVAAPVPPARAPVGIAGFGRIGRGVAARVSALGHPVLFWDPPIPPGSYPWAEQVSSLAELAEGSVHLSLHLPLTAQTSGVIDAAVIDALGPDGHLVNTSRGGLIDELALLDALDTGRLAAASLDVVAVEPPSGGSVSERIAHHPRVLCTPHMAYLSTDSLTRLRERAAEHMREMLR